MDLRGVLESYPVNTKFSVLLSNYTPTDNGSWKAYEIALDDFTGIDLTDLNILGFYTPVTDGATRLDGTIFFDDIHLNNNL